jgi:hypothetical protein
MHLPGSYVLDQEAIKLHAYQLICLFYANKEISRLSDPEHQFPDPAALLERTFFPRELTRLLLNIAIAVRTLDDQMNHLPADDPVRREYEVRRDQVNRSHSGLMFDAMSLREACNKIIHATAVEPHTVEGMEQHKYDEYMWEAWQQDRESGDLDTHEEPAALSWEHLSGFVRLGGTQNKKEWWHLLEVSVFVEAVYSLVAREA